MTSGCCSAAVASSVARASKRRKRAWSESSSEGRAGSPSVSLSSGSRPAIQGAPGAERGAQRREVGGARERPADLHPRPVGGRAAAVPAAAPRPGGAARRGVLDELARERRLADARLAGQQDEAAAPGEGALERRLELRKLAPAPHEARTSTVAQSCGMHSNVPAGELRGLFSGASPVRRRRARYQPRGPGAALERAAQLGGDPAAVEVAGLGLHELVVEPAGVHPARIERDVVAQRGVRGHRVAVGPGRPRLAAVARDDVEVGGDPLPLTEGAPGGRLDAPGAMSAGGT